MEEIREETLAAEKEEDNPPPLKDPPQPHNKSHNRKETLE